ncbi:MAG: Holliday junction branch migration DNA helicase RuvB [Hydrogenothermaceae bacterium]|nr:Holliday junction branch migration DNA helicase RuvB [Hydrogenothermaceae bacterium]
MNLRPKTLSEYIGQEKIKKQLEMFIQSAKKRNSPLDHIIVTGPPGLGKTTLASVIANEMEVDIKITSAPVIEKKGDIAGLLTSLKEGDILFIDEIHRLPPAFEEILYPAMEDFKLDIVIGGGSGKKRHSKAITLTLNRFTLIGATTRIGLLSTPLLSRFGIILNMDYYSVEELSEIVKRSAGILGVDIDDDASVYIAQHSRGTPRIANRLLKRVYDYCVSQGYEKIDVDKVRYAFNILSIKQYGIDDMMLKYLHTLIGRFGGGPVGITTLSLAMNEDRRTIEEVIEPYLMKIGFIKRTKSGRVALEEAYKFLEKGLS